MNSAQNREIIIVPEAEALATSAAERILRAIEAREHGPIGICLTGGSTPKRLYELLAREPWRGRIPWERIHWFFGDDRFVPHDDPRSNVRMAREALLNHVPAPFVQPMETAGRDLAEAARAYEARLHAFRASRGSVLPLFDVVLMGMGPDGHTASLFPGQSGVDERTAWVIGVPEAGFEPFVPRLTLTLPVLASCTEMLFLVSGAEKRGALTRIRHGEDLPAGQAWSDGRLIWLVDRAAAEESA